MRLIRIIPLCTVCLLTVAAMAQNLPPPSRSVYRCEVAGKTVYSDSPCLAGKKVDVEPTRGLNKSSGTERVGSDVRAERTNEAMAEALRPVFNETPEQRATRHRRAKLLSSSQIECARLDRELPAAENYDKAVSTAEDRASAERRLYSLRLRSHELKC
jgi:hypothetical protein